MLQKYESSQEGKKFSKAKNENLALIEQSFKYM